MPEFHFVEDYERLVRDLIAKHPIDEAMALAVGGLYDGVGEIESDVLRHAGLRDGMFLVDLGCGSGRLAHAIGRSVQIEYLGTDIVQALLDYARTKAPSHYRFVMHRELSLPVQDASADMVCAFSVFTHLLHEESYLYLEDIKRALRPGGRFVFSFLEFADPAHWVAFQSAVDGQRTRSRPHLNTFIERTAIDAWCGHLGYELEALIDGDQAPWGGKPLWQAIAVLRKA